MLRKAPQQTSGGLLGFRRGTDIRTNQEVNGVVCMWCWQVESVSGGSNVMVS